MRRSVGPWQLLGELGRGGMAVVHAARHTATGELAAVKTTRTDSHAPIEAITREIGHLARLRHPGIVRILDHGVDAGAPWYAMEWLEGRRLDEVSTLRSTSGPATPAPTWAATGVDGADPAATPEPADRIDHLTRSELSRVTRLIRRLCAPLAWLHGEGLVHRDLKPENVLVRDDGQPVLVDFGLTWSFASPAGREALQIRGSRAGTPTYMAPEQIRGERVDARADLYALGCVLYQLVAGRPPFVGSGRQVIAQHLGELPIPLSERLAGVPSALDDVVLQLLAKRADARIGYAVDVAAALAPFCPDDVDPAGPPPRLYTYRPRLLGRRDDLADLEQAIDRADGVTLVTGESGVGKTRLVSSVAARAPDRGFLVLAGECPDGDAAPLQGFRAVLESLAQLGPARGWHGGPAERLAAYATHVVAPAAEHHGPADRLRIVAAVAEVLGRCAEVARVLVVIDDVQWADPLTIDVLAHLARARTPGVAVVGTLRIGEGEPLRDQPVRHVALERLDVADTERMVRDMLAIGNPDAPVVRRLIEASEGNPLYVVELVRWAVEERLLRRDGGAWSAAGDAPLKLPRSLSDLIDRRLAALAPAALAVASMLAVLGRSAPRAHLVALASTALAPGAAVEAAIDELERAQVLDTSPTGRIGFTHDQLRAAAYARTAGEPRAALHREVAALLGGLSPVPHAALARHRELGGEPFVAARHYALAAHEASARYAWQDAVRLYRASLRLCDDPAERVDRAFGLAEELARVAPPDEALEGYRHALGDAREVGRADLYGPILLGLGHCELRARRAAPAAAALRAARRHATVAGDALLAVRADLGLGQVDVYNGALDRAKQRLTAVAERLRDHGSASLQARVFALLSSIEARSGRSDLGIALLERALTVVGDRHERTELESQLGYALLMAGRLADARQRSLSAATTAGAFGHLREEALARSLVGLLAQLDGDDVDCERQTRRALELNRALGAWNEEVLNLANLATTVGALGRVSEARRLFDEAEVKLAGRRFPRGAAILVVQRATLERRLGSAASPGTREAAEALEGLADAVSAAIAWCEVGHQALAKGGDAAPALARAELRASEAGQHARTFVGRAVERLRRALASEALVHGEHPDDVPAGLRR